MKYCEKCSRCIMNLFTRLSSKSVHCLLRQSKLNFVVTRRNTSFMHNTVICRGLKLWYLLPGQIRSSRNLVMLRNL